MSLREDERSRSRRAARAHAKQKRRKQKVRPVGIGHNQGPPLLASLGPLMDDRCLTFREWCALNGIGQRTGRRILASGNGPVVTQLSERRQGITVRNNRIWQEARALKNAAS